MTEEQVDRERAKTQDEKDKGSTADGAVEEQQRQVDDGTETPG